MQIFLVGGMKKVMLWLGATLLEDVCLSTRGRSMAHFVWVVSLIVNDTIVPCISSLVMVLWLVFRWVPEGIFWFIAFFYNFVEYSLDEETLEWWI